MAPYPELEPSLVEVAIGEVDEPPSPPSPTQPSPSTQAKPLTADPAPPAKGQQHSAKPVQRSMSDRYSYRAAIYRQESPDYDYWPSQCHLISREKISDNSLLCLVSKVDRTGQGLASLFQQVLK